MNRNCLLAIVAGVLGTTLSIAIPVAVVQHNGTVREVACIKAGGSYVLTANGSGRECRQ